MSKTDELVTKKQFSTGGFPKKGELFICGSQYEPEEVLPKEKSNVMGECNYELEMQKLKGLLEIHLKKGNFEMNFVENQRREKK